jgi:solute carrier family 24 (sodium/potassium/calcium exchanger), member 6
VTILAFGNGSPDLFTALTSVKPTADTELMFAQMMGAAAFTTTIIAGTIAVISPFVLEKGPFLRDVLFFMASVLYIAICVNDGEYTLYEGIGTIMIYLVYISVVIVTNVRAKLEASRLKRLSRISHAIHPHLEEKLYELEQTTEIEFRRRATYFDGVSIEEDGLFMSFLKAIVPIDVAKFQKENFFLKMIAIVKAPIVFVLLLIIPVVDYGIEDGQGWCRLLNALHCVTLPMYVMFCTESKDFLLIFFLTCS